VEYEQSGERKARVIVHIQPLVLGNTQIGSPASAPPATGWKEEEQYQPGDQRWDERYQAADIDQRVDGDAFHENPHGFLKMSGVLNPVIHANAGHPAFILRKKNHASLPYTQN
jgi:hypothetical protein